jgi:hypothetical protein
VKQPLLEDCEYVQLQNTDNHFEILWQLFGALNSRGGAEANPQVTRANSLGNLHKLQIWKGGIQRNRGEEGR